MNDLRAYVAYGACHCRIDMREDDRIDELAIKATSEWIFKHMRAGHDVRVCLLEDAEIDPCPHGPEAAPPEQQKLF